MENQKFKLQQVFLGSKRFNYAHLDMKEYVHVSKNGIEFRLPNFFQGESFFMSQNELYTNISSKKFLNL